MNRASPARLFRVIEGPHRGLIVGDDDSCECDECDGSGEVRGSFGGDGYGDRCAGVMDWEADCPQCNGVGRVLGYPSVGRPIRLEVAKDASMDRPGEDAGGLLPARGTHDAPAPWPGLDRNPSAA